MRWAFLCGTNHLPFDGYIKFGVEKERWFDCRFTDYKKNGWDVVITVFKLTLNFGRDI